MRIMPIRHVADVQAAKAFWTTIGLETEVESRPGTWYEMRGGTSLLGIHGGGDSQTPRVDMALVTEEPIEDVLERISAAGIPNRGIVDEDYGRVIYVQDPEGLWIQIIERELENYT